MYEVTCFHCGHVAQITPDAEQCAVCGADLKHLITTEYASSYFYERAAEMAAAGEVTLALVEVERGLAYIPSSELNLLAAILAQRLGDFAQMRRYVSAIPIDDALRGEAEWLLRSQQPSLRQARAESANGATPAVAAPVAPALWIPEPPPRQAQTPTPTAVRWPMQLLYGSVATALIVLILWLSVAPISRLLTAWFTASATTLAEPTPSTRQVTAEPAVAVQPTQDPTILASAQTTPPIALPTVAANVSLTPTAVTNTFDLKEFLALTNRPELADLDVVATLQASTLTLRGNVALFDQRAALIEQAQRIPGVATIEADGLTITRPTTYTVQPGDTLWFISYKLFGVDRVEQLYQNNQDVLSSPEALQEGQVLKVPEE